MGKLRIEPQKRQIDLGLRQHYLDVLQEGHVKSVDSHVFYDLEEGESATQVKKDLLELAFAAGINVNIRIRRKEHMLHLTYRSNPLKTRMSGVEIRKAILSYLEKVDGPASKKMILEATGVSSASWNIQILELIRQKKVKKSGNRRDTTYLLA